MNTTIKKVRRVNIIISSIFAILVIIVGILFIFGEYKIETGKSGYTTIFFENLESTVNSKNGNFDSLSFSINNFEDQDNIYKISIFINGEEFDSFERKIASKKDATIIPGVEMREKVASINSEIDYEVEVKWKKNKEKIQKKIIK